MFTYFASDTIEERQWASGERKAYYIKTPNHLFDLATTSKNANVNNMLYHAEPKTAVSILISADFLKMAPLVEEVLQYVHDNINLILEAQVNLSCLSDAILTR